MEDIQMTNRKKYMCRGSIYLTGLILLVFGVTLNTKTGLGASALISIPFTVSGIWSLNLGNMTLISYVVFVALQLVLHLLMYKSGREGFAHKIKTLLLTDILQLPLALLFSQLLNLFSALIPDFSKGQTFAGGYAGSVIALISGIIATGIGAAMMLNMRLIPNPADGAVQALSDFFKKEIGFMKNCFDVLNVAIAVVIALIAAGRISGIGIGTLFAALGVGRVISLFNHFFLQKLRPLAG